jgi:hypothetical protein
MRRSSLARRARLAPLLATIALAAGAGACGKPKRHPADKTVAVRTAEAGAEAWHPKSPYVTVGKRLTNRIAYIPAQCFTKTSDRANPCYTCHTEPETPNYTNDGDLQLRLLLPEPAKKNPWSNVLDPPVLHVARLADGDVLTRVRATNYFAADGSLALAQALATPPADWDENGNGKWDGYVPDAYFHFDEDGFDHRPDGTATGWRAMAYYPFPGAFFPTNGSTDDVLVRLDPLLQTNGAGEHDDAVYKLNFAIALALVTRHDVPVDPVNEATYGVDLDLDGHLGTARRIAFDAADPKKDDNGGTRMRYVGALSTPGSKVAEGRYFPISPGLLPLGTEMLHTVRYLDVGDDGVPRMAARMKEVRYARKVRWEDYHTAHAHALIDAQEEAESQDGSHEVTWEKERGVYNKRGWMLQGFIEAKDGSLRPQTFEESASCAGCHGGLGATVDSTFTFARQIGWYHWTQHDLRGLPEPKRIDGKYEYAYYLQHAGAGDELRENHEVLARFFDASGAPLPAELARLHGDVSTLLLPSAPRALDLDRAYLAIVDAQSFNHGRDPVLTRSENVHDVVPVGASTGVGKAATSLRLAR